MSKEKRRVPKLRFPGFTEDWEQREFSDIFAEVKSGLSRMLSNDDIGLPVVRANNINDGQLNLVDDIKYWYKNDPQGANTNNYLIEQGDILINFINSEAKMGTAAYVTRRPERDTIYTTNILRCKVNDEYNPYFIYSLTFLNSYKNYIASITKPAVNQASFTTVDFKKYSIKIPTVKEQNQIADLIKTFNKLITLHQRKLDNLKLKKKALLQKLFPKNGERYPELRFPGFTDAWEQCKLGSIGSTYTGLSGKTKEDFGHGEAQYITYLNVFQNTVSDITMTDKVEIDTTQNEVKYGDVLFTTSSETPEEVGMSSVWLGHTPNIYLNSFCFGFRPNQKIDPYFLGYSLRAPYMRDKIKILAQGISRYNISKNKVMELEISLPNNEEQSLLGIFLRNIDLGITLHQ